MTTDAKPPTSHPFQGPQSSRFIPDSTSPGRGLFTCHHKTYKPAFNRLLEELGIDSTALPRQRELELIAVKAFTRGVECGYQNGFEDGQEEADEEAFDRGRNEGFADGYEDGYSAGLKEAS